MPRLLFHCLALISFASAPALPQSSASGTSSTSSSYDPTRPPSAVPVNNPQFYIRFRQALPAEEYAARKVPPQQRQPISTGLPRLEVRDLLSGASGRSPDSLPLQPLTLTPTTTFEGLQQTSLTPPDPDMAAGPDDLIMVVNSSIARYSRTGQQTNLQTLQQWFSDLIPTVCPFGGPQGCRFLDPTIRYDSLHGRFLISCFSEDSLSLKTHFVLSVSNGTSFTGGWKNWALEGSRNGTAQTAFEVDFPQLGYDANAVYLTANMFNVFSNILQYAKIRILKKSELYNPATTTLTFQDIWDLRNQDNTKATSIQPTVLRGRPDTGVAPGILVNAADVQNADYLTLWRINDLLTPTPVAVRTTISNLWRYDFPALAAQKGTLWRLDPGDNRILKAVVRNGILYTARNSGYPSDPTTVTYDRISLSADRATLQARHIAGTFFYPAFDVPASQGPTNAFPNKLITGTSTDPNGNLTFVGISDVKAGEDVFEAGKRWGDYFGGAVDPVQGGLWVYGEYAKPRAGSAGRWGTWASYFPVTTSPQFTDVPSTNPFYDPINVIRLWSITQGCSANRFCPNDPVTRGQMAVFIVRALLGDTFTFPQSPYFTDVPANHPFFAHIQKLRELGITTGCTGTTYCPDNNVNRGEMAVFVIRAKLKPLLGEDFSFPSTAFFGDVATGHPFFKFIQKLRELGVTGGCSATTYCPEANITREQMAAFLTRGFLN